MKPPFYFSLTQSRQPSPAFPPRLRRQRLFRWQMLIVAVLLVLLMATGAMAVLRRGDRGPAITSLQLNLQNAGYNPGPIDGVFGSQTESAILDFQRDRGLTVDGVVGPATEAALTGGGSSGGGNGSSGDDTYGSTVELQQLLTNRGCYSGPITGVYGPRTQEAVMRAQRVYGLVVDGVAGPATFLALRTGRCNCS